MEKNHGFVKFMVLVFLLATLCLDPTLIFAKEVPKQNEEAACYVWINNPGATWYNRLSHNVISWTVIENCNETKLRIYLYRVDPITLNSIWIGDIANYVPASWKLFTWDVGEYMGGVAEEGDSYYIVAQNEDGQFFGGQIFEIRPCIPNVLTPRNNESYQVEDNMVITWTRAHNISLGWGRIFLYRYGRWLCDLQNGVNLDADTYTWHVGDYLVGGPINAGEGYSIRIVSNDGDHQGVSGVFRINRDEPPPPQTFTVTVDIRTGHGWILPEWSYYKVFTVNPNASLNVQLRPEDGYVGDYIQINNGPYQAYPWNDVLTLTDINENKYVSVFYRQIWW